ncbi:MAG: STAS domain-containing protein [Cytophagaceae bacterium]|jgi:anti-sigma B factor antagonist|nr:STAS domain-containing protein [Cytophagaceae bacterium]
MLKITDKNSKQEGILDGIDRLNALVAPAIKDELTGALSKKNANLILNMENITFIDSTGIGVLISALKAARQNNGSFLLANVNKNIMNLLTLMKLDKVFDFAV